MTLLDENNLGIWIIADQVFTLVDFVGPPTSVKIADLVQRSEVPAVGFFTGAECLASMTPPRQVLATSVRLPMYLSATLHDIRTKGASIMPECARLAGYLTARSEGSNRSAYTLADTYFPQSMVP